MFALHQTSSDNPDTSPLPSRKTLKVLLVVFHPLRKFSNLTAAKSSIYSKFILRISSCLMTVLLL